MKWLDFKESLQKSSPLRNSSITLAPAKCKIVTPKCLQQHLMFTKTYFSSIIRFNKYLFYSFRLHFLGAELEFSSRCLKTLLWPTYFDFPIYCQKELFCNYLTSIFLSLVFSVLVLKVLNCCLLLCAFIYNIKTLTVTFIQLQDFSNMNFFYLYQCPPQLNMVFHSILHLPR